MIFARPLGLVVTQRAETLGLVTWSHPVTLGCVECDSGCLGDIATGAGGYVDIGALVQQLGTIPMPMSYTQARQLCADGLSLINTAESEGQGLPGQTARDTVQGKLQFHDNVLNSVDADQSTAPYLGSWDLVFWVQRAAIEANAVVAAGQDTPGFLATFLQQAQSDIAYIKSLPGAILNAITAPTIQNAANQANQIIANAQAAIAAGATDAAQAAADAGNQLIAANAAHPFQVQAGLNLGLLPWIIGGVALATGTAYIVYKVIAGKKL